MVFGHANVLAERVWFKVWGLDLGLGLDGSGFWVHLGKSQSRRV